MITARLTSIPERKEFLDNVIKKILPQVDKMILCLNGFNQNLYNDKKIEQYLTSNELGDRGKFYKEEKGYNVLLDDKYEYPKFYVQNLIKGIKKYKCIVGFHGRKILKKLKSYYKDSNQIIYKGLGKVDKDIEVNLLGTGMLAYYTDYFSISLNDFPNPNMADIYFALKAKNKKMIVLQHDYGYIKLNSKFKSKNTIFNRYKNNDQLQTLEINKLWQ